MELWASRVSPTSGLPYNNGLMLENVTRWRIRYKAEQPDVLVTYANTTFPPWWGDARVHDSDKAILYRKDHTIYAHFKRYALTYEQYVWPYQLEEEARRRQRVAAGVEVEGRESEGDEEPEGFAEEALEEKKSKPKAKRKSKKAKAEEAKEAEGGELKKVAKKKKTTTKAKAKKSRVAVEELVELDEDDEQVDAAVVADMQTEHEQNGQAGAKVEVKQKSKRQKRPRAQQAAREESNAAIETTEEEEAEDDEDASGKEANEVRTAPKKARGRAKKLAVKLQEAEQSQGEENEVSAEQRHEQRNGKAPKRQKHSQPASAADSDGVEVRRSGRRSSVGVA